MLKRVLSPALVAFLLFGCGGNAESDSCQEGRQFYQKLKKAAQTGDRDGDGTVDIVEQEMLPALSEGFPNWLVRSGRLCFRWLSVLRSQHKHPIVFKS